MRSCPSTAFCIKRFDWSFQLTMHWAKSVEEVFACWAHWGNSNVLISSFNNVHMKINGWMDDKIIEKKTCMQRAHSSRHSISFSKKKKLFEDSQTALKRGTSHHHQAHRKQLQSECIAAATKYNFYSTHKRRNNKSLKAIKIYPLQAVHTQLRESTKKTWNIYCRLHVGMRQVPIFIISSTCLISWENGLYKNIKFLPFMIGKDTSATTTTSAEMHFSLCILPIYLEQSQPKKSSSMPAAL